MSRDYYYILEDGIPKPISSIQEWGEWLEKADRTVAKTKIGKVLVSTVFLGLDHQWGEGPPLLFETLVFEGLLDGEMERYSTLDEAKAGHEVMVERVRAEWTKMKTILKHK